MIRFATPADSLAIAAMGKRFAAAAGTGWRFDAAYAEARARQVILDPNGAAILWDVGRPVGVLAATLGMHPLFPVSWASELIWWIEPEHRGGVAARAMAAAYEDWARERGAAAVALSALDDRAGRLMARLGYAATSEARWIKELG